MGARECESACTRVLNLCFALRDSKGRMGSQSVSLQINSLIPDTFFSTKKKSVSHLTTPSPLLHYSPPQFLPRRFYVLAVNQATCRGSCVFVWESNESLAVEAWSKSTPVLSAEPRRQNLPSAERDSARKTQRGLTEAVSVPAVRLQAEDRMKMFDYSWLWSL